MVSVLKPITLFLRRQYYVLAFSPRLGNSQPEYMATSKRWDEKIHPALKAISIDVTSSDIQDILVIDHINVLVSRQC